MKKIIFSLSILMFLQITSKAQDPAFDDFERTGGLGSNWTSYFGSPTIVYDSDLGIWSGSFCIVAWTGSTFSANQYCEAIISPDKIDSMWAQVFVRRRTSDFARYAFHWSDNDGNTSGRWDIKYDGVPSPQTRILDSLIALPPLPGDTLRIEVITNINGYPEIKGFHNGNLVVSAIDSAATKIMNGETGMVFRFRIGFSQTYPQQIFEEWRGGSLITTWITETSLENNLTIYPNPATNFLFAKGNFSLPSVIELFDVTGNKLLTENITSSNQKINVTDLAKGFYLYKVITKDNKQANGKIVIE